MWSTLTGFGFFKIVLWLPGTNFLSMGMSPTEEMGGLYAMYPAI